MLAFSLLNGFSQTLHYGLGLGLNYNTIVFTNLDVEFEQPKYKPGFQMNAVIGYNINDKLGLRFEPGFSNRGAIIIFPGEPDSRINLNYISIPILFKYAPINRLSILAGPEGAIKLTAKSTSDGYTSNLTAWDRKFDFGINAGFSYRLIDKLEIGLRYNRGFISTISHLRFTDVSGNQDQPKLCNQGFAFTLIYMVK